VTVIRGDARWRKAALEGRSPRGARPAAVITSHADGTSSLRLTKFDRAALAGIKAAAPMTWDEGERSWIVWNDADCGAVVDRLRQLGFSVALR
jgi:hypothetical protein